MTELLTELNGIKVYSVSDEEFAEYGRVISGYDFSRLISYCEENTVIPESGNVYYPSIPEMEQYEVVYDIKNVLFGGMPVQVGLCNGKNTTYNGFEYHKSSEINIAVTDFCLVLGHVRQIKDNRFYVGDEKVFFVPRGTAIEMYQTTLHLSPCRVNDGGFMDIVILPAGTNTPLESKGVNGDKESRLLLQKNKWVIAHPDREVLISQGAFPGLIGENKELKYK